MKNLSEMDIHIGRMIKAEFDRQGRKVPWLAEQLKCNRSNVYSIFSRKDLNAGMLIIISRILHHNFLTDLSPLAEEEVEKDNNV